MFVASLAHFNIIFVTPLAHFNIIFVTPLAHFNMIFVTPLAHFNMIFVTPLGIWCFCCRYCCCAQLVPALTEVARGAIP